MLAVQIDQYIENDCSIICANIRLAQFLKHQYSQRQLQKGLKTWETPDILPWAPWVRRCWSDLRVQNRKLELLLNSTQEALLWQQIIRKQIDSSYLWHIPSVAAQAQTAWQRMKQYRIPEFSKYEHLSKDAQAFSAWALAFVKQCQRRKWIDASSLPERIVADLIPKVELPSSGIVLVGFDDLNPQQEEFIRQLKAANVQVVEYAEPRQDEAETSIAECSDINEEIHWAALWAKQKVAENPQAKIGILVPELRDLREQIGSALTEVLSPNSLHYGTDETPPPFNITLGRPLSEYPMISVILMVLTLNPEALAMDELGQLLRSPFIRGYEMERSGRAMLDEKLRCNNKQFYSLEEIKRHAPHIGKQGQSVKIFIKCLSDVCEQIQNLPNRCVPSRWSENFANILEAMGWLVERDINHDERQQSEAWGSILETLASVLVVRPELNRSEALSVLRREFDDQSFQHHTPETPIEIMDAQGAAAMRFDHVWMLGLNEGAWPPQAAANPFIPIKLQVKHGVPNSDAQLHFDWIERLQQRILRSSPEVVFSFSRYEGDRPLLGSPLLPDGQRFADGDLNEFVSYQSIIYESRQIDTFVDIKAPSVAAHSGGTGLFRDQSQCPFRAFAVHRLRSRGLEDPDIGLSASQRGLMLHQLMQGFWEHVKNHETLVNRSMAQNLALIELLVIKQIEKQQTELPTVFSHQFSTVEAQRLKSMMESWLEIEKAREPFTVVGREMEIQGTLQGIRFKGRIDRVDELEDGTLMIIDYKTGAHSIMDWNPEHLNDPQMPLYAVTLSGGEITAVVYASLTPKDDLAFRGLANRDGIFNFDNFRSQVENFNADSKTRKKFFEPEWEDTTWEDLLAAWQKRIEQLADEFRQGHAQVSPISPNACRWCDQAPLCRIDEIEK